MMSRQSFVGSVPGLPRLRFVVGREGFSAALALRSDQNRSLESKAISFCYRADWLSSLSRA